MRDMTFGSAHSHLWRYALPPLLGNWLQLAYNAVDSIIAGRFILARMLWRQVSKALVIPSLH